MDFTAKTALITGATSGIGRATALAFAQAGGDVVLAGRNVRAETKAAVEGPWNTLSLALPDPTGDALYVHRQLPRLAKGPSNFQNRPDPFGDHIDRRNCATSV